MVFYIDQRAPCGGDHTARRMATKITESINLVQVYIVKACSFFQHAIGRTLNIFIETNKIAQQGPKAGKFLQVGFDQQNLKLFIVVAKYYTVNRNSNVKVIEMTVLYYLRRFNR